MGNYSVIIQNKNKGALEQNTLTFTYTPSTLDHNTLIKLLHTIFGATLVQLFFTVHF